jgi:hypothetical protein
MAEQRKGKQMTRIILALGFATLMASTAVAAPVLNASPRLGLVNGQTVTVKGHAYTPGETVFLLQCNATVTTTGEAACDTSNIVTATTTARGRVPATPFTVKTGTIGNGTCGTGRADKKCYIASANASGGDAALAAIVFVP